MAAISKADRRISKVPGSLLTVDERRDLEFQTRCDRRTIIRWERGADLTVKTKRLLDAAAKKMGLPVPLPAAPPKEPHAP
jgi:hypothetical protein